MDGALFVNDTALAIRAVSDGLRLMQFARVYFAPMLADGCIVTVLDDWVLPPFKGFYLYYPSRPQRRPALRAFIDFLLNSQQAKQ